MADEQPSPWLTVDEVRQVMKCAAKLVYREVKAGRLRAAHIGGRRDIRIHRDWIDEYLTGCAEPIEVRR